MEILVVRGANLASLRAPFEIRFDQGPLSRAVLFAISGPTGSGKSTILDAMFLALFGRTPRLGSKGKGESALTLDSDVVIQSPNHPRQIISADAKSCYAEIEFRATDGSHFRARWSANRGTAKTPGKIEHSLARLNASGNAEEAGSRKAKETPGRVAEVTGMTLDVFARSVILAQGAFDQFLRSDSTAKATTLEAILGGDEYDALVDLARQQQTALAEKVKEIQVRQGATEPLTAEVRQALETQRQTVLRKHQAQAELTDSLSKRMSSLERREELGQRLAELSVEIAKLSEAESEIASLEQGFASRRKVLHMVESMRDAAESQQQLKTLEKEIAAHLADLRRDEASLREREAEHAAAQTAAATAREALTRQKPDLQKASDRWVERKQIQAQQAKHTEELQQHQSRITELEQNQATAEREILALTNERNQAVSDFQPEPFWQRLADQREVWHAALGDWIAEQREIHEDTESTASLQARLSTLKGELQEQAKQRDTLANDHLERIAEAEKVAKKMGLPRSERSIAAWLDGLATSREKVMSTREAAGKLKELQAGQKAAHSKADLAHSALSKAQQELATAQTQSQTALAHAAETWLDPGHPWVLAVRQQLKPGDTCPVCGAEHQPGAGERADQAAIGLTLESLELPEAHALRDAERRVDQAQAAADAAQEAHSTVKAEIEKLQSRLLDMEWPESVASLPLGERIAALETWWEGGIEAREKLMDAKSKAERLEASLNEAEQTRVNLSREQQDNEAKLEELEARRAPRDKRLKQLRERLDVQKLDEAGLAESWQVDPEDFMQRLNRKVEAFDALEDRLGKLDEALAKQTEAHKEGQIRLTGLKEQSVALQTEAESIQAKLNELSSTIAKLTDVEPAEALSALESQAEAAAESVNTLQQTLAKDRLTLESARGEQKAREEKRTSLANQIERTQTRWQKFLKDADQNEAQAQEWLKAGPESLEADEARVATFRASQSEKLSEREHCLREEAHLAEISGEDNLEDLRQDHERATQTLTQLAQESGSLAQQIEADDQTRQILSELAEAIKTARAEAEPWTQLLKIIAWRPGAFKHYALAMLMNLVVSLANDYLKILRPRYALERARAGDSQRFLELALRDHVNGGVVRPVDSLSGGETFLVSLSLALGLSRLAAGRTRCNMLFIDEGFGSLDEDALDQALAALYQLPQGRQVGVISHMPAVSQQIQVRLKVEPQGFRDSTLWLESPQGRRSLTV